MEATAKKYNFTPKTTSSSFAYSILAHAAVYGALFIGFGLNFAKQAPVQDYLDLGYQTFDEAPEPQKIVKRESKEEIQDEKSDIAGTQKKNEDTTASNKAQGATEPTTPYYHIKPKYPRAALLAGTEGWVQCEIDINEKGEVENIRVVDGAERNMFEGEAKRAVSKFKYRPFLDSNGNPMRKIGFQVRVNFNMKDAEATGS